MFKKIILTIILTLLLSSCNLVSIADKIQIQDNWLYVDNDKIEYNEMSIDTIQMKTKDGFIGLSIVNTNRPIIRIPPEIIIARNFQNYSFSFVFNFSFVSDQLYLTQEGGLPIFSNEKLIGSVDFDFVDKLNKSQNLSDKRNFNDLLEIELEGNPSRSLATAEPEEFSQSSRMYQSYQNQYLWFRMFKNYLISTDHTFSQPIRNYTITPFFASYDYMVSSTHGIWYSKIIFTIDINNGFYLEWEYANHKYNINIRETIREPVPSLELNKLIEDSSLLTIDNSKKLPTYIKQTTPTKISKLGLSQIDEVKEYFLVDDKFITSDKISSEKTSSEETILVSSSEKDKSPLFFFNSLIILILFRIYKKQ